ncbi:tyrosine-type recombinase/integrase [Actinophytocola sp.]|uniref:tyrosine-type recombinase/integrase n=1 Tax=Actinophytocola sp. TaxID=1872138 RepID=UPI00389A7F58
MIGQIERQLWGRVLTHTERIAALAPIGLDRPAGWPPRVLKAPPAWHRNLLFVCVPDVPFDAAATARRWSEWAPLLANLPLALCVQDGATVTGIPWNWPGLRCLFMALTDRSFCCSWCVSADRDLQVACFVTDSVCDVAGVVDRGRVVVRLVIGDVRVQEVVRGGGRRAYTIVGADVAVLPLVDGFLRGCEPGTARTYAYMLVDHLRWLPTEGLTLATTTLRDLQRYMGLVGAEHRGPYGAPWRVGKRPLGQSGLEVMAACLKGLYAFQGSQGVNRELAEHLDQSRLPTKADRRRVFLGHTLREMPANPLTPGKVVRRRHPKMAPEGARGRLVDGRAAARDRMIVTWLADGGFRVGELCGLHLADLHLREAAACGECRAPHVHICHREGNVNRSRVKTKHPWRVVDGVICGGMVRRVSPAMISTYFDYMTSEYPRDAGHGMVLVQLHGARAGQPLATVGVRRMLQRAGRELELGKVLPHQFRHSFATGVLDASGGNLVYARDAGGWASATTVDEIYGHADVHDPKFAAALNRVWAGEQ